MKRAVSLILAALIMFNSMQSASMLQFAYATEESEAGSTVDTELPSVPTNFKCESKTDTTTSLSWGASTDNSGSITGYNIYDGVNLLISDVQGTSYNLSELLPGVTYHFHVKAKDEAGNLSEPSETLAITTLTIINSDTVLSENKSIGDLYIESGVLDLGGYTLNVNGNVILSGGCLYIDAGQLLVTGDLRLQTESQLADGTLIYDTGYGRLDMTCEVDYILVEGNFIDQASSSHYDLLTAGILEVKGDFTEVCKDEDDAEENFYATDTHKTILSGTKLQTISFNSDEYGFNVLEIKNYSLEGVLFATTIYAEDIISNGCKLKLSDSRVWGWQLSADETYTGDLKLAGGELDLNGHQLTINGNLIQTSGIVNINGGQLEVTGDYRLQREIVGSEGLVSYESSWGYLEMINEADYVSVGGTFISNSDEGNNLTAGIFDLKGDLDGYFEAWGTSKLLLSGNTQQVIDAYVSVSKLEITNTSVEGVSFTKEVHIDKELINSTNQVVDGRYVYLTAAAIIVGDIVNYNLVIDGNTTLEKDTVFEGNVYLYGGTLNLNGKKLIIQGNLVQSGGIVDVNAGQLHITGNYRIQGENRNDDGTMTYYGSSGSIKMTNTEDYVQVDGNFIDQPYYNFSDLSAGILEVKGDFIEISTFMSSDFSTTGTHQTILSGTELQTVSLEGINSKFNILEIKNYSLAGVKFVKPLTVVSFIGNGCIVSFPSSEVVGWQLSGDETYTGDLKLVGGNLDLNGHKLTINGNLIQSSGTVYVNGGQLEVTGDYSLQTATVSIDGVVTYESSSGYLYMQNEADYVTVGGKFSLNYQSCQLNEGIIDLKGDMCVYDVDEGYSRIDANKILLSGKAQQVIDAYVSINNLEISNTLVEGVSFTKEVYIKNGLINTTSQVVDGRNVYLSSTATIFGDIVNYNLTINQDTTLEEDTVFEGNVYLSEGKLNLNGKKLTIQGNLIQSGGIVDVNAGQLHVIGNYRIQSEFRDNGTFTYDTGFGWLIMTNTADYVQVDGNFIDQPYYNFNDLSAGILEVKGDFIEISEFSSSDFSSTGTHKTILSGTRLQIVRLEGINSKFNILEIKNYSEEGVIFTTPFIAASIISNGCIITIPNSGVVGWQLSEDETYTGDLILSAGVLDLNGHKLTVIGNLEQPSGEVYVNGGQLEVTGDYRLQTATIGADSVVTYESSNGTLRMTNAADYVQVDGSFVNQEFNSHEGYLTAGILEVKGDFTTYNDIYLSGTHKTILSGTSLQTVSLEGFNSKFNILEIKNYSDAGVKFVKPLNAVSVISNGCIITLPNSEVWGWQLSEDETYTGDLILGGGVLDLNGHKLTINGNLIQPSGTVYVNGGQLVVTGGYRLQTVTYGSSNGYLKMINATDYVQVAGSFVDQASDSHDGYLTAGTLEVKGDFIERSGHLDNFYATGTHKTILSGTRLQTVNLESSESKFNILEIKNYSEAGVKFIKPLKADSYISNGSVVSFPFSEVVGWQLSEDETYTGHLILISGELDLNGHKLTVNGNLIQSSGTVNVNGGKLEVTGDYRLQTATIGADNVVTYGSSTGYLKMINVADYVKVEGSFIDQSHYYCLRAGILEVMGDFTVKDPGYNYNFYATGTHKTILSGTGLQTVSFENPQSKFNTIEIKNYSTAGVKFASTLNAVNFISDGCIVNFPDSAVLGWQLSEDQTYTGNLMLGGGVLDLNGHKLTVNGNLIQSSGTVYVNGGNLEVTGDYRLQTAIVSDGNVSYQSSYGYLKMTNLADYVMVGGQFISNTSRGHSGYLTAGILDLKGDMQIGVASSFDASETHHLLLSGSNQQVIDANAIIINNLEITNTSVEGVSFTKVLNITKGLINSTSQVVDGRNIMLLSTAVIVGDIECYNLVIKGDTRLETDTVIEGNVYLNSGILNLNGKNLTIGGSLIQSGGIMDIHAGQLYVTGNYCIQSGYSSNYSDGYLKMINEADYVQVVGNFIETYRSKQGYLTAGVLEVMGNIELRSGYFNAAGTHKTLLSGLELQTVMMTSTSRFNTLEIKNYSQAGVEFTSSLSAVNLISNGCRITFKNSEVLGWQLSEDVIYSGDLNLAGDILDLNGHKLTVNGNLKQSSGTVHVNGGQLEVTGDYRLVNGYLKMTDTADLVEVGGKFIINTSQNNTEYITAGILDIKGDIEYGYYYGYDYCSFITSGTNKLLLSGSSQQVINADGMNINILEITNTSVEGVKFARAVKIVKELRNTTCQVVEGRNIQLLSTATIIGDVWNYDLSIMNYSDRIIVNDTVIEGSLYLENSTLNLNGKKLTIGGNFIHYSGTVDINAGKLYVTGDYRMQKETSATDGTLTYSSGGSGYLKMTNSTDYVLVENNFIDQSYSSNNYYLTAGILEVKGDFTEKLGTNSGGYPGAFNNFYPRGTHKTILSGSGLQTVSFERSESAFNTLEIKNYSLAGVKFTMLLSEVTNIITNGCVVTFPNTEVLGWQLSEDETYTGDLTLAGGSLDLNGHKLIVTGNLIQPTGTVFVNGGQLEVIGDYRLQTANIGANGVVTYGSSNGNLKMTNAADYVKVGGKFIANCLKNNRTGYTCGNLTAGTLELEGDMQINGEGYFPATGTHKLLLSGIAQQVIGAKAGYINTLEITNSSEEGVRFTDVVYIRKELINTNSEVANGKNITLLSTATIVGDIWNYDLTISGTIFLKDTVIKGNLYTNSVYLNGKKLTVGGNLIQYGGSMRINMGQLVVAGDYRIQSETHATDGALTYASSNGVLYMIYEADYVLVGGSFIDQSSQSHKYCLTAGTLEVKGDFIEMLGGNAYDNFYATGTHKTKLSGSSLQTVSFESAESQYNTLIITQDFDTDYSFNRTPVWNTLIEDSVPTAPTDLGLISKTASTVNLSWTASIDDVGVLIYDIYRDHIKIGSTTNTSYTDIGLEPNKTYDYYVKAHDIVGNQSEMSNALTVSTDLDTQAPTVPEDLYISLRTASSVSFIWAYSTDNVKVTGYEVYRNGTLITSITGTSYTDSELLPGDYIYTVKAFDNSNNFSVASNAIIFDIQAPTAPELSVTSKTTTSVELGWTASNDTIGVTGYDVYRNGTKIKTVPTTSYNDVGLLPATTYTYMVKATDAAGNSSIESNTVEEVTIIDTQIPTIPTNLTIASKTGKSATLTWTVSTDNVSVSGYEIYRDGIKIGTSTTNQYTDTGLTADTSYNYSVSAYDAAGNQSDSCLPITVIPLLPHITNVLPLNGVTIGGTSYQLAAYFTNSLNSIGSHATFEYSTDGTNWTTINAQVYGPNLNSTEASLYCNWDLADIESGTYSIRYTVYDATDDSDTMTAIYQVDRTAPAIPLDLTATSGDGMVNLLWEPSPEADVSLYKIYRSSSAEGIFTQLALINGRTTVTYTDTSTIAGQTYFYKVSAVDKFSQESNQSEAVEVIALADTTPPVIIGIEPINNTTVGTNAILLVRAEDNLLLSSVKFQYSLNGTSDWIDIQTINTTGSATVNWTLPEVSGNIYVRAIAYDSAGNESDGSPIRTYIVDQQGPELITGLTATAANTSVTLHWNDISDNDFAYFQVEKKDTENGTFQNIGKTETTLGMNVPTLSPDTMYWFRVVAYDRLGNRGLVSSEVQVETTPDTQMPVITVLEPKPGRFSSSLTVKATVFDNVGVTTFTFQTSSDKNTWTDVINYTPTISQTSVSFTYIIDVTEVAEGPFYVRAIAGDAAGNHSDTSATAPFVEHMIDHTNPEQPSNFVITPATGYMTLAWSQGVDMDLAYYRLYRSTSENGTYHLIADHLTYISYNDRDITHDNTYFYKVIAVDVAGNESTASNILSGQLAADTEAPKVISVYPTAATTLPANPVVSVLAFDNYKLSKVTVEYKAEDDTEWVAFGSKDLNTYSEAVAFNWNTSALASGNYLVRAFAQDEAGNTSELTSTSYSLNLDAPATPVVTSTPGGWKIDLSWTSGNEADLAGFRVYRSALPGGSYKLRTETTSTSYSDTPLSPGQNYYYKVEAVDKYGNACMSTEITSTPQNQDPFAPTADAGIEMVATIGMEVAFDGTLSKDNERIASYEWEFGDGSTSSLAQPNHVYETAGTFTVTLTVTDPTGNTATDTTTVAVYPEQQVGTLEVRVIDSATGVIIPGASVYVDFPGDEPKLFTANGNGIATVVSMAGNYNISAYKTGYLPSEVNAKVEQYKKTQVTIKIEKGELVVGEITVRRMAIDEIVAAGIDVHAPENQFVYNFAVQLEFNQQPLPVQYMVVNGHGTVYSGSNTISIGEGTNGSNGSDGTGTPNSKRKGTIIPQVIAYTDHPEVAPTVAYLVIPQSVSWLKEFFEVGLVIKNMADEQFVITDATATLKLPTGLTLAPTAQEQSLSISIGDLAGQEAKEVKWIIRGDEEGFYDLEADFKGTLMPFVSPVNASFKTQEPFRVWGGDALHIYVMAEEAGYIGESYYTHFMIVNESEIPIYNISTSFGGYQEPIAKTEIVVIHLDGTKEVIHPDGSESIDYIDGTKETIQIDGSKSITHKDGSTETVAMDGVKTITHSDGTTETIHPSAQATDENGGIEYTYSDESTQYIYTRTNEGANLFVEGGQGGDPTALSNNLPVIYPGDSLGIGCLMPGETIVGTYVTTFAAEGDPDEVYYVLSKAFSTTMDGSNTEIPVTVSKIPSHMNKYKIVQIDQSSMEADPVDTNTGALIIENEALGVMGATPLTFDIDYNSRMVDEVTKIKAMNNGKGIESLFQIGKNTMGNGWSHNYETWLTENADGSITVYWSPSSFTVFYPDNETQRIVYGTTDNAGNITLSETDNVGAAQYHAKIQGMKDYTLNRNEDGSYDLICSNANQYYFNHLGELIKLEDQNERYISLARVDGKLVITEPVSGQTLTVEYNAGMVVSVADQTGRKTLFSYDSNQNLTAITDPNANTTTYTYDDKGHAITGTDAEGRTYFTNTYDDQGRVLTQDDGVDGNMLTTFSYDETSEFWRTITTITDRNGNTSKNVHNRMGQLVKIVDELGNITTFTYDGDGNRTSMTDPKGYTTLYAYDAHGNMLTITDAEGTETSMTYDGNGNVLTVTNANGETAVNIYNEKNLLESTTDQRGNATTFTYDDNGQILTKTVSGLGTATYTYENGLQKTATDYLGNSILNEYDSIGRVIAITDREGNRQAFTYDAVGNILTVTDPLGNQLTFTVDSHGNVLSEKDERGNTTTFQYNGNGYLIEVIDPKSAKTAYTYDGEDRQLKVIDPKGYEAITVYDATGKVTSIIDALNNVTTVEYDLNGNVLSETLPSEGKNVYSYYKNGKIQSMTDAVGNKMTYTYDLLWRMSKITDAAGKSTSFTYDETGNVLSVTDPLGNKTSYTYDSRGNLITSTDANGNITSFHYNLNGQLSSVIDVLGNETQYQYNQDDMIEKIIDAKGNEQTVAYDACGRVTSMSDALGNTITLEYDASGNLVKMLDAYGYEIQKTTYDSMNLPTIEEDALGNKVTLNYDSIGRLVEVVDALNRSTTYTYDKMNRVVSVVDPLNGESKQSYDVDGNLQTLTDPNGNETVLDYDLAGRLVSETTAIGSVYTYGYNSVNLLSEMKNGRNQETLFTYDEAYRLVSFSDPAGTVEYTYDPNGNVLTVSDETGTISREFDALNRVTKYTDCNGKEVKYAYDEVGNLLSLTYPGGKIVRYEYNAANSLVKVTDWADRVTNYEYDKNGRLIKTTRSNGTVLTTTYDAAGQMLQQKDVDAAGIVINQYDYTYDAVGCITVEQSTHETAPFQVQNAVMTYDVGNRLISYNGQEVLYDADGNMTYGPLKDQMVSFTYDSRNRLTQAGDTTYLYDAENNRIAVIENGVRTEVVNNPHAYLSQLLVTQDAQGNQTFYVYGNGLIGQEEVGETYKTYHFDSRGSTTAITDATGAVTDRFEYGPYGELVNRTGTTLTPFLYNGRDGVITDHNGLYYMRARYYNPDIKRFINQDVIQGSINDGRTLNRYAYVNGNPVSLTDPFGLSPDFSPLSIVHGMLDLVSMIDPTGVVDGINAGIYFLEGDKVNAAIAAGCVLIPAFFDAGVKVAKWGSKSFKSYKIARKIVAGSADIYDVGNYTVKRVAKGYDYARETWKASGAGGTVGRLGDDVVAGAGNAIGKTDRTLFMKMDLQLFAEKGADDVVEGVSKFSKGGSEVIHGNSKLSTKTQHGYEIFEKETGDVVKTGISGQPLNKNGTSPRANSQVNKWNNTSGADIYDARVVNPSIENRIKALEWEENNALRLWEEGNSMNKHVRPKPWE